MAIRHKKVSFLKKHLIASSVRLHLFMKNYDRAINQIKAAIQRWPEEVDFLVIARELYVTTQDWEAYIEASKQIEEMFPDNISFKIRFGSTLIGLHRYDDAVVRLTSCQKKWSYDTSYSANLANLYALLGICYGYLEKWDSLKAMLQEAENLVQTYFDPDNIYARLLLDKGINCSRGTQSLLDEQTAKDPSLHALYYWKGLYIQYYLHDLYDSIKCYRLAIAKMNYIALKNPQREYFFAPQQYAASWYLIKHSVDVCIQLNRRTEALWLIFMSRLKMLISNDDVRVLMVYLDVLEQSFDVAEKKCLKMLKKKLSVDSRTEFWLLLALSQAGQGKLDDGAASAKQARALDSEKLEALEALGSIHILRRDWIPAVDVFRILVTKDYFNFQAWAQLGLCYLNVGDLSSAKFAYERAVNLNPSEADTWIDLASVYMQLGESDLARSAYEKGLKYEWLDSNKRQQALEAIHNMK